MKRYFTFNFSYLISAVMIIICSQNINAQDMAENPFIRVDAAGKRIYTADPSAHVWGDGRLYVYASHDIDPPRGCDLMDKYHVFSTDDMVTWIDHGQILEAKDVSWARPEGGFMWAPDCAYRNGVYYFYFPHKDASDTWRIGVATSTKPASDFEEQGYITGMFSGIDPCVFIDDDGQAYIYQNAGGDAGGGCAGGKLKENMVELDGGMKKMEGLVDFHEASWVHKRNGIYYLSYSDNYENDYTKNRMQYATSTSPLGPWTHRGVYMDGTTEGTIHGSIVEYKGQWYSFYHNNVLSYGTNPGGGLRSICVDKLYYNEDGTIQKVIQTGLKPADPVIGVKSVPAMFLAENYTTGTDGVTYHDSDAINDGGIYRNDGVDIEPCSEGKGNIFNIESGEWLGYRLTIPRTDLYKMEFRVSSAEGKGAFHVEVNGVDKTGKITIPRTNGSQIWTSVYLSGITLNSGSQMLRVCMDEPGFNFANFTISYDQPTPPVGKKITLKNGSYYVTINESNQLICNSTEITPNCVFTVETSPTGKYVELKGNNGKYVTAKSLKSGMTCDNSSSIYTKLLWYNMGNNQVGLRGGLLNTIICSENGTKPMNCNRYEIGAWEKFTWQEYDASSIDNVSHVDNLSLQVYPIPALSDASVTVSLQAKEDALVSIQIIDMQGRIYKEFEHEYNVNQKINISTNGLSKGTYLLRVTSSGFNETTKLIII